MPPDGAVEVVGDGVSVAGHLGPSGGRMSLGPDGASLTLVVSGGTLPADGASVALRVDDAAPPAELGRHLGPVVLVTPALAAPPGATFAMLAPRPVDCPDAQVRLAAERPGDVGPPGGAGAPSLVWRSEATQADAVAFTARLDRLWGMRLVFVCAPGGSP